MTVISSIDSPERTDETFRSFLDPHHHKNATPLLLIDPPINMVHCFVLDFMHLGCLGVMKRLLEYWTSNTKSKISSVYKLELSRRLQTIRSFVPNDFQRKPRNVDTLCKWKATELMLFLLYTGPIVLKGLLRKTEYNNFLLLHMVCRLLCTESKAVMYVENAKEYLRAFCASSQEIYGEQFAVINVHYLIHLADDVRNMNSALINISAYSFENCLGMIKKVLRSPNRPLAQLCRRIHEKTECKTP